MTEFDALSLFEMPSMPGELRPITSGLIHSTFVVHGPDGEPQLILQKINTTVFPDVDTLERNAEIVTARLREAAASRGEENTRSVLSFVPATDGRLIARDNDGEVWRLSRFISNTITVDIADTPELTGRIAAAFAGFQRDLWDLPPNTINPVIPDFHNTPLRLERLRGAAGVGATDTGAAGREPAGDRSAGAGDAGDAAPGASSEGSPTSDPRFPDRLATASGELAEILGHADHLGRVQRGVDDGTLTVSICHNDTKVNNVLLDRETLLPLCVIDLDTVGPGSFLADVGDMLRTAAASASEEESDLSRVHVDLPRAKAVVDGFLSVLGDYLNDAERGMLEYAGWLITMEQAVRYLTDYLQGDIYYGERYPGHNLTRTRNQLSLARSMADAFGLF